MRTLLTISILTLLAGTAFAQFPGDNLMGVFFSDTEFTQETTNIDSGAVPFNAYLVLVNATVGTVGGYECAIDFANPSIFVLSVSGPNGWTNFGDNTNHLCGYQVPLPSEQPGTVLATLQLLYSVTDPVEISLGPATPPSIPGDMAIANGANPDELIACPCLTADCVVATIWGDGVVATEDQTWSSVKSLFE